MGDYSRVPPEANEWWTDWKPSHRPIQLPIPALEYGSQFKVWEWRIRNLLDHNCLLRFVKLPAPNGYVSPHSTAYFREAAATTHCLALLGSSISEKILIDILTLSPDNKLPNDPYVLFKDAERLVHAAQTIWKDSNSNLWAFFMGTAQPHKPSEVIYAIDEDRRGRSASNSWRDIILVAALLVKRYFPSCLPNTVRGAISKVQNDKVDLKESDWKGVRSELVNFRL